VDIVLPEKSNIFVMDWAMRPHSRSSSITLRVYLSPPPFDHAKIFVVDRLWSLIGSTKLDPRTSASTSSTTWSVTTRPRRTLDDMAARRIDRGRPLDSPRIARPQLADTPARRRRPAPDSVPLSRPPRDRARRPDRSDGRPLSEDGVG
jgi:cardiolipin synthase